MPSKAQYSDGGIEGCVDVLENRTDFDAETDNALEEALADLQYIDVSKSKYRFVKRALDIVCSVIALTLLLLPFVVIAVLIFIDDPGPVLFRQYRVGYLGKRFRMYKFRSMKIHAPKYMPKKGLKDSCQFVTRLGKLLRKYSIDELPQMINVLIGDMSLIGPRPLISDEYEIHRMRMKYGVYNVRPGITGLAQINGRDTVAAADKVRYDLMYLANYGLISDLKILLMTIPRALCANGVTDGKQRVSRGL